ncbi:MFS general substrate transporter [Lentinus tigrinus ALCF2SS1-6]|uniref:MFS general substrate transporter n=1 Tax=Lentinus tigrinus ALCF2SS1-6 TaxID=1328759 RepID=A0A5C2RT38_9APHY|nr:MFS general substrate transporter [Lentinus tigrinus ALCF2SS1-6]
MASSAAPDVVIFSKTDPADPKNWSRWRKRIVVFYVCALALCSAFGSSIYATTELQIRAKYNANADTASAGLTVYVLGFSFGPLVWGPMSEIYGRKLPYMVSWPILIVMSAIDAFVDNLAVIIVFRFLTGAAAACALNNGGGIMSDLYNIVDMQAQAIAISWYAASILSGPCVALVIGFFIVAYAGPNLWALRVFFFFTIAMWPLVILLPETHGPTILAARSKKLRNEGRPNARAAHELKHQTKGELLRIHFGRPAKMFVTEPIIQGAAVWTSLSYGIVYFFFEVYTIVFFEQHHFRLQLTGLPFIAIIIGTVVAAAFYVPLVKYFQGIPLPTFIVPKETPKDAPEMRLKLALFACVMMPISLFWFAWTSSGSVHWIAPTLAGVPFGFATITLRPRQFFTFLTYTSQTYTIYASSSGACNIFARCLIGSFFPIVAHSIVDNLGSEWGVSVFGFISFCLLPIPLVFLRWGPTLRARSPMANEANAIVAKMRAQAAAAAKKAQEQAAAAAAIAAENEKAKVNIDSLDSDRSDGEMVKKLNVLTNAAEVNSV